MKAKRPCFYIMANRYRGTTYSGVTGEPPRRFYEHREGLIAGFSKRYGCKLLVYYEIFDDMASAIAREKQVKGGSRKDKIALIESMNPNWKDLYEQLA